MTMILRCASKRIRSLSSISNVSSFTIFSSSSAPVGKISSYSRFFSVASVAENQNQVSGHSLLLRCTFSAVTSKLPPTSDPEVELAFKDLMATSWDELPDSVISSTKKALSIDSADKAGQEALKNLFRAAEASVDFGGVLVSLRMALDDLNGITGENVAKLPEYLEDAMKAAYNRYMSYLESFGPDEAYLKKKVESELGTKMIHLKMRCSGIGSEWGKVSLLGTSGISGSYVEQRA